MCGCNTAYIHTLLAAMLHLQCTLQFRTMPVGNSLPIANRFVASDSDTTASTYIEAKTISGITMENVIPEICKSIRSENAFSKSDAQMRKEIATTVLITMGKDILHFEKNIDPKDGTVHVDWMFTPRQNNEITDSTFLEHSDMDYCECPEEQDDSRRIKSHAIMRVYSSHTDPQTGNKYSYLLGCEAIDLGALMQHTIHVNSGHVDPARDHQFDFALRTNFSNTFVVCTVLPTTTQAFNIHAVQEQLNLLRTSVAAYEHEEVLAQKQGRKADHSAHDFMPSVLR